DEPQGEAPFLDRPGRVPEDVDELRQFGDVQEQLPTLLPNRLRSLGKILSIVGCDLGRPASQAGVRWEGACAIPDPKTNSTLVSMATHGPPPASLTRDGPPHGHAGAGPAVRDRDRAGPEGGAGGGPLPTSSGQVT